MHRRAKVNRFAHVLAHPQRWSALRRLLDELAADHREPSLFDELVGLWGNGSSADARLLRVMVGLVDETSGPILELGSGLSSLVLDAVAARHGRVCHVVEHDSAWRLCNLLDARLAGARAIKIQHAPLRSYGAFEWYDVGSSIREVSSFDLVLCDGPPGASAGGRYGALAVLDGQLNGAVVLVDDAERPGEAEVLRRWEHDFGVAVDVVPPSGDMKGYALVRVEH